MNKTVSVIGIALLFAGVSACGGGEEATTETSAEPMEIYTPEPEASPNGVGPVSSVELGEIDAALAAEGGGIFSQMCVACHKMDKRHVGPGLDGVLDKRSPEWVMNMILNPEQMVKEDPQAKALFAEYLSPMANQNLTEDQARAVLEYFRSYTPTETE
ncbi:MAG: cytochrome c [Flavobacteriales bacterium]|nr:cytochrome c [Flavobacteriales bacterium]MBT6131856.1 cytochrome c [Flavobacteriales bacterium]MBT6382097.1 cytochrome c [Flavobacteriales bacterium]MBT7748348.1 cytochrome c [Flavobacteriales bacterium]